MNCTCFFLSRSFSNIPRKKETLLIGFNLCHYVKVKVKVMWPRSPTGFLQSPVTSSKENQPNMALLQALRYKALDESQFPCFSFHTILKGSNNLPGQFLKIDSQLLNTLKIISVVQYHVRLVRNSARTKSLHISYPL